VDFVIGISDWLYAILNGLSGRSGSFDLLAALAMDNPLVKSAPVAACFAYAWYAAGDESEIRRRRGALLVTLLSLLVVAGVTRTLSDGTSVPRPFVQSVAMYELEGGQLIEAPRRAHRVPLEGEYRSRHEALTRGDVVENDLVSFPSDHAGFYLALALGIFLACRWAGLIAMGWTVFVILLSRILTGMHSPLDIAAGGAIGVAILLALQFFFRRWGTRPLEIVSSWSSRHSGLAAALLLLVLFEAASTLENVRSGAGVAARIVE
jgi:membrane-associated phospholipid phosphatase